MKKILLFTLIFLILTIISINDTFATIPVPTSQQFYQYTSIATPILSDNPSNAMPVSVGSVASQGNTVDLQIGCQDFSGPVNVYFAISAPLITSEIYLLTASGLQPLSQSGLLPWKSGITGSINEYPFGTGIPTTAFPPGAYNLFLAVTPAGSIDTFYLWQTHFLIEGLTFQEVENVVVNTFGERGAFDATVLAMDKGYSLRQIVGGALTGRLLADGTIVGEVPEYPLSNIIVLDADSNVESKRKVREIDLDNLFWIVNGYLKEIPKLSNFRIVIIIWWLANEGYTFEQIVASVILDTYNWSYIDSSYEIWIEDNGVKIIPGRSNQGVFDVEKSTSTPTFSYSHCKIAFNNIHITFKNLKTGDTYENPWTDTGTFIYKGGFKGLIFDGNLETDWINLSGEMTLTVEDREEKTIDTFDAYLEDIDLPKMTKTEITGGGIPVNITGESLSGSVSGKKACENIITFDYKYWWQDELEVTTVPPPKCDESSFIQIWCGTKN